MREEHEDRPFLFFHAREHFLCRRNGSRQAGALKYKVYQMSTIVTGSVAYDNIMNFPGHFKDHILPEKIHILNLSFLVDTLKRQRGGVAANIAYTMALL